MTNEEALKICRLAKEAIAVKHNPNNDENEAERVIDGIREQIKENADLDFMIDAIEKQIPKKTLFEDKSFLTPFICPTCKGEQLCVYCAEPQKNRYCMFCGQRLVWRNEE